MTDKTPHKQGPPPVDQTRMAYEAHTLAQMLYGQLAVTHPWSVTPSAFQVHDPFPQQPFPNTMPQMTWSPWSQFTGWGWGR